MKATWIAGFGVAVCVAILLIDYGVAGRRRPIDEKAIKDLQQQVKTDAALAPKLAAEEKRITAVRLARKRRDSFVAWLLVAAAAAFLTYAKRELETRGRAQVQNHAPERAPGVPSPGPAERRCEHAPGQAAAEIDLTFVDELVAKEGRGPEAAILLLQAIQVHYRYLPDEALRRLCDLTEITPAQIAGTSSFYGQFRQSPAGKYVVRVCHGTACHVAGARQVSEELRRHLAIPEGADTDPERMFTLEEVACVGCCSLAPVLVVDGQTAGRLTPATACDALAAYEEKETA